jgi:hypothetical protein
LFQICEPRACYFSASSKYAIASGDPDCPSRNSAYFFTAREKSPR